MSKFLQSLEKTTSGVKNLRASHVAELIVARFNAWRYGPRLSSEQLASDRRQLELARNALSNPYSARDRLAIAANLGSMAHRLADELVARGDDDLIVIDHGTPVSVSLDGKTAGGGKAVFIARD